MSRDNFWQVEKGMTKKQENEPKNNVRDTDVSVAPPCQVFISCAL